MLKKIIIKPQTGPQTEFLSCKADICIFGGAAGGSKTYGLLLDPLRYLTKVKGFGGVIFRRVRPMITNQGGLWDTAKEIYSYVLAKPRDHDLTFQFPIAGAMPRGDYKIANYYPQTNRLQFSHMQYDKDKENWHGSQIPFIGFDELTQFTKSQFFYLLSRARSTCGVRPYVRATTNPDANSWVRTFLDWWIDNDTGYAIYERSGKIRWMGMTPNEGIIWGDSKEKCRSEMVKKGIKEEEAIPKSVTFIASNIYDNKILLEKDPGYIGYLNSLPLVDRERLLKGNWNIKDSSGNFFKSFWFGIVEAVPKAGRVIRYWDRGATQAKKEEDKKGPSYTVGLKMRNIGDNYYIEDVIRFRESHGAVKNAIVNTASRDGIDCIVGIEQDPGQAGKVEALNYVSALAGYDVRINAVHESKGVRAKPLSAQVEHGFVKLVKAPWNDTLIREYENFDGTDKGHADQVDAGSGAFFLLTKNTKRAGTW